METISLNNNIEIPQLGFGVFQITDQELCGQSVSAALEAGYRLFDTAACYGNEGAVGNAIKKSGIDRREVFLTSKVWIHDTGYERTKASFEATLHNLQTDYLDLYLIHMPYGDYYGSWRAMEEMYGEGKIRAIGVCNFEPDRLLDLILNHRVVPSVNQIELHPFCQQVKLRRVMAGYHIQAMAWAPFAEGKEGIFKDKRLVFIGQKYGKTSSQVILRFLRQERIIAIPKSVHKERIEENYAIDDFQLGEPDMNKIRQMDGGSGRILEIRSLHEVKRLHDIRFTQ